LPTSPDGTILVEHAWKRFRADRAKPKFQDQMAKIGRRLAGQKRAYRWVLKDVNFEIKPGETLGVIGVNGSGKSTLLKCISHCMWQTAGRVETYGRIGALLEVRGGIQPVLSGRENIFMFGSLLGLSRKQLNERFENIAEFAEITDAIDRQVKYYSSGMQVRLGFAIASHLDAEILLVDEVLAVGDANFQQKCLRHISDVVKNGTSLMFVSHDLAAVESTCDTALWLSDAVGRAYGPTREVLARYRESIEARAALTAETTSELEVLKVEVRGPDDGPPQTDKDIDIRLVLNAPEGGDGMFSIGVSEGTAVPIFVTRHRTEFPAGEFEVKIRLRDVPLPKGHYFVWMALEGYRRGLRAEQIWKPVGFFDVLGPHVVPPPKGVMVTTAIYVYSDWELS
jgi:ABC-type polysaccharide/polyol phosphate transport system ATPase subunit